MREGARRTYNPGVDPSIPSAQGLRDGIEIASSQPVEWTPANPAMTSFLGTAANGQRVRADVNPNGVFAPNPATHAQVTPHGVSITTTPGARANALPSFAHTPAAFAAPQQMLAEPPVIPVGNDVVFPQHLRSGAPVNGFVDPRDPNAIWVDHPAPGPHTGAAVYTGRNFLSHGDQQVPRGGPPIFTSGAAVMPSGQPFAPAWAAAATPAAFATPGVPAFQFATPAVSAIPVVTPAVSAVPIATPAVAAVPVATPAWPVAAAVPPAPPANCPTPPDWLQRTAPEVALIPTLGLNPVEPSYPHLKWDLAQMPSAATVKHITGRVLVKPITHKDFKQVALYPPRLDMYITLGNVPAAAHMHARWGPIVVRPNRKGEILVGDVLDAVYTFFQEQLYFEDFTAFDEWLGKEGDPNYEALKVAYGRRLRASSGLYEVERKQGFKRVDMLGDNRRWCGLYRAPPSAPGDQTVRFLLYLQSTRHP